MDNLNQIFESILLDLFEEKTPQEIEAAKQAHAVEIAKSGRKEDPDLVRRKTLPTPSKKKVKKSSGDEVVVKVKKKKGNKRNRPVDDDNPLDIQPTKDHDYIARSDREVERAGTATKWAPPPGRKLETPKGGEVEPTITKGIKPSLSPVAGSTLEKTFSKDRFENKHLEGVDKLYKAAKMGDRAAMDKILAHYYPTLFKSAAARGNEDYLQDTFLNPEKLMYPSSKEGVPDKEDTVNDFLRRLTGSAKKRAIDASRSQANKSASLDAPIGDGEGKETSRASLVPDQSVSRELDPDMKVLISKHLKTLPPPVRRALGMVLLQGFSIAQVVQLSGMPETQIRYWLANLKGKKQSSPNIVGTGDKIRTALERYNQ
jgi:DNA-directed RNA polymerase specialized sigma24 family protein